MSKPLSKDMALLLAHQALMDAVVPENDRWMMDNSGKIIKIPFATKPKTKDKER